MGSWGFKALENDLALDILIDLNRRVKSHLHSMFRVNIKKDNSSPRVAAEYIIRNYKANLLFVTELEDLAPLAIKKLEEIKADLRNPDNYYSFATPEQIEKSAKEQAKDINRQIRFFKKINSEKIDRLKVIKRVSRGKRKGSSSKLKVKSKPGSRRKSKTRRRTKKAP